MEHKSINFEPRIFDDVLANDCSPEPIVDGTRYSVEFPACLGNFEIQNVNGTYRARLFGKQPTKLVQDISVVCECGLDHPNRPATEVFLGCGATWRLTK